MNQDTTAMQLQQEESRVSPSNPAEDFARRAAESSPGFLREFWDFLRFNKKWWLTPIIVVLLIVGLLVIVGGSVGAPFIYTLF